MLSSHSRVPAVRTSPAVIAGSQVLWTPAVHWHQRWYWAQKLHPQAQEVAVPPGLGQGTVICQSEIKVLCRPMPLFRPCFFGCQAALHPHTKTHMCTHVCKCSHTHMYTHAHRCTQSTPTHPHTTIVSDIVASFFMFPSQPSLNRLDREGPFREVFIGPNVTSGDMAQAWGAKGSTDCLLSMKVCLNQQLPFVWPVALFIWTNHSHLGLCFEPIRALRSQTPLHQGKCCPSGQCGNGLSRCVTAEVWG